ncbi:MAG TPA: rhomboid family intramembrane serine protease [Actinomycetota bacterium]|nr:rhomboid family intramembrane serine protease [Actinomycetota bacterium]
MIPLRDDNPTSRRAVVTLAIIALNVLAFLAWEPIFKSGQAGEVAQVTFFYCHAEVPFEVTHQDTLGDGGAEARQAIDEQQPLGPAVSGEDLQQYLREQCSGKSWWQSIFVAMFLHGGWLHIGGNMLFLWVFGNNVEDKIGRVKYFLFYIAAGLAAAAAQTAVGPDSVIPNLGASGAIAGVLGAYLVMFPRRRVLTLVIFFFITAVYLPAFVVLGLWFVLQLFNGVGSLSPAVQSGGVAFWAHIGGFAFGAILALLFFPKERFGAIPPPRRPDVWGGRRTPWGPRRPPPEPDVWRGVSGPEP